MDTEEISGQTYASDEELLQLWAELAADPQAPERFELTGHAEVVLGPRPTLHHQMAIERIRMQLEQQLGGVALTETPVLTDIAGIRRADVVWLPPGREREARSVGPLRVAPPLVAEVLVPGNRRAAIFSRIYSFLVWGIGEVAIVDSDDTIRFYRQDGVHTESRHGVRLSVQGD